MNDRPTRTALEPSDLTLDAPSDSAAICSGPQCKVHLVEGSGSELSGETENLLRSRLRSAALLLFTGFASFLVWHTIRLDISTPSAVAVYLTHIVCTFILGGIGIGLCSKQAISTQRLRIIELLTFGAPTAFFMLLQYNRTVYMTETHGIYPELPAVWLLEIFTYALFIPNLWRRAAVVIGIMAASPLVAAVGTALVHVVSAESLAADAKILVEMGLILALTATASIWGVHIINSLRDEAYRARQLGQYRLKRLIGSGGMGDVYLAEHQLMKRPCAIKVIRPEKAGDPQVLARFEREVQATAKLSHWNTVDIFDYGRADDGTFYYVMEYLPGMNLAELIKQYGPMPAARAIHLITQACDALQEAHQVGLVHRDIKPANIFAAARGGVHDVTKLLDFGLAKPLADVDGAHLTQEGSITGSPLFMSPEQAMGDREPDARSDIYALGAVLYYVLTGRPPFEDERPLKVLIAHAHEPPPPPSHFNPDVPDDLEMVVLRCLQKSPPDRYQSAADLAYALENCNDFGGWKRADAEAWWQRHNSPRLAEALRSSEREGHTTAQVSA